MIPTFSRSRRLLLVGLLLTAPQIHSADYHFTNGKIIRLTDDQITPDSELLVTGDVISAIGANLSVPAGAIGIDLNGGYLIPGLTEMHAHVPGPDQGEIYRDEVLFLYLANGVTTIRGMLGSPDHLDLRESLERLEVLGPRLITSGPSFNGNSVSSPDQARKMVEGQLKAGYDFLKIHPGLTRSEYDAVAEAANRLGIPFAGHVPAEVGLAHALASGQATIDHLDGYVQALVPGLENDSSGLFAAGLLARVEENRIGEVVALTVERGAAVVPTETLLENFSTTDPTSLIEREQNDYLPAELFDNYGVALRGRAGSLNPDSATQFLALRKRLIRELHAAGVPILLGSDAPQIFNVPGFSLHRELAAMVAAGLTPRDALLLGTRNPAQFFSAEEQFGTLRGGAAADLIWLRENPLDRIENSETIQGVMVRGRWLDRRDLDAGLAEIRARHAR